MMRHIFTLGFFFLALAVGTNAQSLPPCTTGTATLLAHRDGVTVERILFTDISGKKPVVVSTHAFVPDSSGPMPGVAMSFAAIQGDDMLTDLLPFAWTLARAGAASIVIDRAVKWRPLDDDANRSPSVMYCAVRWLMSHANLDRDRMATAGLYGWGDDCDMSTLRCWNSHFGMGFGQTTPVEYRNTDLLTTVKGQLWMARAAQKELRLKEIDPEWFVSYSTDASE
jgi:hypothetical protein